VGAARYRYAGADVKELSHPRLRAAARPGGVVVLIVWIGPCVARAGATADGTANLFVSFAASNYSTSPASPSRPKAVAASSQAPRRPFHLAPSMRIANASLHDRLESILCCAFW
jgi:hypothetical protein